MISTVSIEITNLELLVNFSLQGGGNVSGKWSPDPLESLCLLYFGHNIETL